MKKEKLKPFLCGLLAWGTLALSLSSLNLIKKSSQKIGGKKNLGHLKRALGVGLRIACRWMIINRIEKMKKRKTIPGTRDVSRLKPPIAVAHLLAARPHRTLRRSVVLAVCCLVVVVVGK